MSQLSFWDKPSPSLSAKTSCPAAEVGSPPGENKPALKCRAAAAAMQKHIDAKHSSANNMLALPPTRKRIQDADSIRGSAIRLEQIQRTLLRLAEMHETGTISPELRDLTSRGAVASALFTTPGDSAIRVLFNSVARDEQKSEKILRWTKEASLMNIPGFFPTPPLVAEQLVTLACIEPGRRILEPSAGSGNLIDAVLQSSGNVQLWYCEMNCFLLDVLREKYDGKDFVHFAGRDFLELDPATSKYQFDRIVMNPPFERGQDVDHILHAYPMLAPKGTLTAIVSAGGFHRKDNKTQGFRKLLEQSKAFVQQLPSEAFKSSGTMTQCTIVRLSSQIGA
jgi:phospholipid N-methyltransferase